MASDIEVFVRFIDKGLTPDPIHFDDPVVKMLAQSLVLFKSGIKDIYDSAHKYWREDGSEQQTELENHSSVGASDSA